MAMIILLLTSLAIGSASGQEDAAIIAPINPLPVKPVLPSITCANVLCIMNSTCVMYEALDGKMKPYCLPIDYKNTCAHTKCKCLEKCVMVEVTCVTAPCYPVPECRPRRIIRPPIQPNPIEPLPIESARNKRQAEVSLDNPLPVVPLNPCDTVKCAAGTQCVLHDAVCKAPPCNPIPTCEPIRCPGKNQEWLQCGSACPKRCEQKEPVLCKAVCRPGCFCKKGFCLSKSGKCVADNNCGILIE
ncbi:Protein CBG20704 [Caenorhabditis briggsae]|uniref:TIL domain-containing protein n=2 Tax=Caenorhabditis briggsae TaxID=6238 RepID=A0AAE9A5G6_CAEBR|nr:Protein CBG20704 [Caenorhabditis briggsae]ULT92603.1 hypothetical protein L3Y34_010004 [Caenorhabditis briggsae]CAP37669.1 Protein CBG20704 [Caenorhabditis briggsae]